jgi:hypothetical protein
MASEQLTDLSNALSQRYDRALRRQMNRPTVLLGRLPLKDGFGKNVAFDAQFSSSTGAAAFAPGSDVADGEYAFDQEVPGTISWGMYRSATKIDGYAVDAAASSLGSAEEILRIFDEKVFGMITRLAKIIGTDLWTGTGTDGSGNPNIIGFTGGALDLTTAYAGISRVTYAEWQSNLDANGGVTRPISDDMLRKTFNNIVTRSGMEPDMMVGSFGVGRKYAGLFSQEQRVVTDGALPSALAALGQQRIFWGTMPVLLDPLAPAGTLVMLNSQAVDVQYLPPLVPPQYSALSNDAQLVGTNGVTTSPGKLMVKVEVLPKTGDAYKIQAYVRCQMRVTRPNACGVIQDISET